MADVPRNLVFLGNSVTRFLRPVSNRSTPTFSRVEGSRLPRLRWRTSEEWKTATQMPIPRLRRHGFGYRSDMAHGGEGQWSDVTLQQVLPIIFVLLYIFRRYWLPLVWQALLAIIVIVAWAVYEMGISVLKGLAALSGRLDFVKAMFLHAWHTIANARQWCASVDAVMFTWSLAARLDGVREDSLAYKQNILRLHVSFRRVWRADLPDGKQHRPDHWRYHPPHHVTALQSGDSLRGPSNCSN